METVAVRSEPSVTVTEVDGSEPTSSQAVLRLRLKKPKSDRKVEWREDTVDNENMGKKKSKCCCIYKKPTKFGESSSEDDEECEHCFGHPEKRKRNKKKSHGDPHSDGDSDSDNDEHNHDHQDDKKAQNRYCDSTTGECPFPQK